MDSLFCFALFVSMAFAVKLSLSKLMTFFTSTLMILSPLHWRNMSYWLCGAELPTGVNPQQLVIELTGEAELIKHLKSFILMWAPGLE